MTWLLNLKSKLALILGAVIGVLLLIVSAQRRGALKKELKQQKAVSKVKDKANSALVEGIENESKTVKRGYFNDSDK